MPLITETVFHNLATKRKTSAKNKLPPLNVRLNHRCTFFFLKLFTLSCIPLSRELEIACYRSLERVSYPIRKSLNAYSRAEWLKRVHTFPWKNCLLTICTVKARLVRTKKKHTTETKSSVCSLLWRWEQKTLRRAPPRDLANCIYGFQSLF